MASCCAKNDTGLPRDILDAVTDKLENCLLLEEGKREFRNFLDKHRFTEDLTALLFLLKCDEILKEVSKWSPKSRNKSFSKILNDQLNDLYKLSDDVNFDVSQAETLEAAVESTNNDEKIEAVKKSRAWALELLRNIYQVFRRELLSGVER